MMSWLITSAHTHLYSTPLFAGSIPDTVAEPKLKVSTVFIESIEFNFRARKPKALYYYRSSEVRFFPGNTAEDHLTV